MSHSPVLASTTRDFAFVTHVRLRFGRHKPVEEHERHHDDDQAAGEPEQEAEGPVERADAAVEDLVGDSAP